MLCVRMITRQKCHIWWDEWHPLIFHISALICHPLRVIFDGHKMMDIIKQIMLLSRPHFAHLEACTKPDPALP